MLQSIAQVESQVPGARGDRSPSEVGLRRKAGLLFSVIVFFALVVGSLFGDGGLLELWQEKGRARALGREVEALRFDNGRLADEVNALRRDPRAIERVAREELGLIRPGETVFLLREQPLTGSR